MEELQGKKLTYAELVGILANLAVRLDHLENTLIEFSKAVSIESEFLIMELNKVSINNYKKDKKTPYKMLMEEIERGKERDGAIEYLLEHPKGTEGKPRFKEGV